MTERAIPPSQKGSSSRRWGWAGLGFVCLIALCAFEYLNFTNFCYAEVRYLGDQGICDGAIRDAIARVRPEDVVRGAKKYSSLEEFYQVNPVSCTLDERLPPRPAVWVRRASGQYFIPVYLWWKYKDNGPQPFTMVHYLVDPCGKVRDAGRGGSTNLDHPPPKQWGNYR